MLQERGAPVGAEPNYVKLGQSAWGRPCSTYP